MFRAIAINFCHVKNVLFFKESCDVCGKPKLAIFLLPDRGEQYRYFKPNHGAVLSPTKCFMSQTWAEH